ncbi:MAG: hypothetical protein WAN87_06350 [Thermoplasmata archaeon]
MADDSDRPRFREHLHDLGKALGEICKDVKMDVAEAPHLAKEGTRNTLPRVAGVRRTTMHEWTEPSPEEPR